VKKLDIQALSKIIVPKDDEGVYNIRVNGVSVCQLRHNVYLLPALLDRNARGLPIPAQVNCTIDGWDDALVTLEFSVSTSSLTLYW
jgi:hypothetical protein